MSERDDYLVVEVRVMVNIGPNSAEAWPEERCEQRYREVVDAINEHFTISTKHDWWVV